MEKETQINSDKHYSLEDYWRDQLAGCSTVLNFPYDFVRKISTTGYGDREYIGFSPELSSALRRISKSEGVSLYSTMLTTYGILMHKYSGDHDINIGTPVANRFHSSMESIIGMFVNTVVIRLKFDKDISFRSLLRNANEIILDAIAHQDLSFDKIVEIVNPERIANINPVFQVAFAWDENLNVPLRLNGVKSNKLLLHGGVAPFDITCSLLDNGEVIEGEIEYNIDLLDRDTIIRLRDNYINLVSNLVSEYERPVSSVPLISDVEKKLVLGFTGTSVPYPGDKTIAELFEEQVKTNPYKTAVVYKQDSLTYDDLNRKSNRLARRLKGYGIKVNEPVGLLLDKSIDLIVGLLGILKAGGAYLPLDPDYPAERINFMISDSHCQVILTQDKYKDISVCEVQKILLDSPTSFDSDDSNIVNEPESSDLAYIMYTSGTTGKPKGSLIRQKSVIRLVRNTNYIELTAKDRLLLTGAMVFDATTFEIWGSLLNGGSLYIPDKEEILDPKQLCDLLYKNEITTLWLTSALFTQIAEYRTDIFSRLNYLLVGGDVLSPTHINKVRRDNPGLIVINGYGPTENTTFTTCYRIERDFEHNIPIGKPISNTTVYIFDKYMNLQPVGVLGELYTGGEGLSKGYLNRDDLNLTKFIDHPSIPGERLYRTGDYARWMPDGNIEFHGRADNQIKVRGFRVETEEIESLMLNIEGVIEAVVKTFKPSEGDTRLVAFLNVKESFVMEPGEVAVQLRGKMPSYMIPSVIRLMHGFPLTINGKIDRGALKYEGNFIADEQITVNTGLTPVEEKVYRIWSDVLKTREILPDDNFFEIGGNSLLAIGVINRIEENLGINVEFKDIRKNPTIRSFSNFLEKASSRTYSTVKLFHRSDNNNFLLTQSQKRMWLVSQLNPANPGYILSFTYKLSGPLNINIFQKSIEILFNRHHVLFSSISEKNGNPYCSVNYKDVRINFIDFSNVSLDKREAGIFDFINIDSRHVLDLKDESLYRLYLISFSDEEYYFTFTIHHIIFDGWSWQVFIKDLGQIYNELLSEKKISLKPLVYQQYDFAELESNSAILLDTKKLTDYWRDQLAGCSTVLNFPYDFVRKISTTGYGDREYIGFSPELSSALRRISKSEGVSLYSTMLTTYGILMHKYSGDHDINIGTPVANRFHSSMESIIGMFVNTVVIRLKFDKDISFRSLLRNANEIILDAIAHQDLSFDKIVEIVNPERIANINPVFQVAFAWDENLNVPLRLNGVKSNKLLLHGGVAPFDITCSLLDNGEVIEGEIEYNIDLLDRDTIIRLRDNYINLVSNLVSEYERPVSSVPLISDVEKKLVLGFTGTSVPYPGDKTIAELFEEQVKTNPYKTAVVYKQDSLTYDDLNRKSNRLARRLKGYGIKVNEPVGLLLDKSIDLIVGLLGILKAGGAYLPLDPDYPAERINFMISDSHCQVILTQDKYKDISVCEVQKILLDSPTSFDSDDSNIVNEPESSDLAYIMYTSGTTGKPKGSLIRQKSVIRLVRNTNYIELTAKDRLLLTGAMVFDATTFEIWGSLLNGGSLYIPDKEEILDPKQLCDLLYKNEITTLWLTSALFTQIAEYRTDIFSRLNYLLVGGDVLSPTHINKVRRDNPGLIVINGYGPTENTTFTTCYRIERDFEHNIPIGKPISNTTVYIFDKYMNLQPVGVLGELYTGGEGLSKGYLNRDDLNLTKFIDHPSIPGERLYRTGDYARWMPDGNIEFHGRADNQIKVRGFRVETEEIESLMLNIEGVIEAVVKTFKPSEGDTRLVAFLNVKESFVMEPGEVAVQLRGKMPSYMIPSVIRLMHGFPLTINGKIDRGALKYEGNFIADEQITVNTGLTPVEEKVYRIWSDVLKTREILPDDNFFEIGGNSLLAISILSKIESEIKVDVGLRIFFDNPRLKDFSKYLEKSIAIENEALKNNWPKGAKNLIPINARGTKTPLILIYCGNFSYFLSDFLGSDQPVYGFLDDTWVTGLKYGYSSVESLATDYIDQLKRVIPESPYVIGGHSIGGVIAYEMAIQLKKQGNTVPFLTLFDTMGPESDHLNYRRKKILDDCLQYLKHASRRVKQFLKLFIFRTYLLICKSLPKPMRSYYIVNNYLSLLYKYKPEKSNIDILLFKGNDSDKPAAEYYGWEFISDRIRSVELDGDHMSIMKEKKSVEKACKVIEKQIAQSIM